MARPKLKFDVEQIKQLAAINCTNEEIAAVLGCSRDTIEKRFSAIIKAGKGTGRMSLKRRMWKSAMDGSVPMQIFLSKQMCGYSDKIEHVQDASENYSEPVELSGIPDPVTLETI